MAVKIFVDKNIRFSSKDHLNVQHFCFLTSLFT